MRAGLRGRLLCPMFAACGYAHPTEGGARAVLRRHRERVRRRLGADPSGGIAPGAASAA